MAVSDYRQRSMPTMEDRESGQILAYPEAVLLTNPANEEFRGEVFVLFGLGGTWGFGIYNKNARE